MSRKYKFHNPEGVYFISFAVRGWVDVFTRNIYKDILVDSLAHCIRYRDMELFAWCIMSNHVHLMARANGESSLPEILRDFKKFTSKKIFKSICENHRESRRKWLIRNFSTENGIRFWRGDNRPIEVWSNAVIAQKLSYIHNNLLQEGLVFRPEEYPYSSALDHSGEKVRLDVPFIELRGGTDCKSAPAECFSNLDLLSLILSLIV
jgi:REP element-mobilizing transposase RayT